MKANGQIETQEAIDVTDYMGEYIYRNNILTRILNTEGACVRQSNGSFVYEYDMKDHLGNTRVTFSDVNNDWTIDPNTEVSQINHYYPYGLNMVGNWNGQGGANKYQYNSKEWNGDYGLDWNHHDWRFYDPAIGRFVTIDRLPEEEEQEQLTPYQFAYNNPVRYDDPDGQCPTCPVAAVGAVVGGVIGGLIEAGSQLYSNGEINDWKAVGGAAAQGAITGAVAGLTAGGSLLTQAAVAGIANGVGGAASNAIQGKDITVGSVAKDVAIGAASAVGSAVISKIKFKVQQHHSDPMFLGGDPKQKLTPMITNRHQALHKDLNKHLQGKLDKSGNSMTPKRGNSGDRIRRNFSRQERIDATREFYNQPTNRVKYFDARRDFKKQHP